jgi:exosome complex component RRP42
MATAQHLLLSPAELAYLHSTLSLTPPIRPDGRTATQFRPLSAETGILPGTNGSARICFADGTEAIVGVKAEVEKTKLSPYEDANGRARSAKGSKNKKGKPEQEESESSDEDGGVDGVQVTGSKDWVDVSVEVPGFRDDDSTTVFMSTMLSEALLADGEFTKRLWINRRFHWKMYLDVSLLPLTGT